MGTSASVMLQDNEVNEIAEETGFSPKQIHRLFNRFKHLDKRDSGFLTREELLCIPEVNINPLGERLVDVIIEDYGENDAINFKQFVRVLAQFKRTQKPMENRINSKENKLRFLFNLYDRNHDNRIDKLELLDVLKMMVGGNINDVQLNEIAEHTISELDTDKNHVITFNEFCATLQQIDLDEKMSMKFMS